MGQRQSHQPGIATKGEAISPADHNSANSTDEATTVVVHAAYGARNSWANVTDKLVDAHNTRIQVNNDTFGVVDPLPGVVKRLRVRYLDGHVTEWPENTWTKTTGRTPITATTIEDVSIVLTTYKRSVELQRAVASVLRQTYQNWHLYIVGDACPTLLALSLERLDPRRITVLNLDVNHGAGGAVPRNVALKSHVKTKLVAFLDDDNEWAADHLQTLWTALQAEPTARFAISSILMDDVPILCDLPLRRGRVDTSSVLFEYSLVAQYGYWKDRSEAGYAHDWEFFNRWQHEHGVATRQYTLVYSCAAGGQNPLAIKAMYDDQQAVDSTTTAHQTTEQNKRLALTTLVCNDRACLFDVLSSVCEFTAFPPCTDWVILAQGCSAAFVDKIQTFITEHQQTNVCWQLMVWPDNKGLSAGVNELAARTRDHEYVLHIEDDFICLPPNITKCDSDWLKTCCAFLDNHPLVSTLFLRQYATDQEKYQYGWTRCIPYQCHRFSTDNFNWATKIKMNRCYEQPITSNGLVFERIPNFLFTFNPVLRRNAHYYQKHNVFPVPSKMDVVANRAREWSATAADAAPEWGHSEALVMEKTRDLLTYNVQRGIFGHFEDWQPVLKTYTSPVP